MPFPNWFPDSHIQSAETISEYLITLRGGAPFLSGADCRLLVQWLDEEIPTPAILSALERVALRRRAKRVGTRLSLNAAKGELRKILGKEKETPQRPSSTHVFTPLYERIIENIDEGSPFSERQKYTAQQLLEIDTNAHDNIIADRAISLLSSFHQNIWEEAVTERISLLERAEEELSTMKSMIPTNRWNELVEEIARDQLRSRYPLFSAQMIWNSLKGLLL